MSKLSFEATRWTLAALSIGCILAVWTFDLRSGPALGLLFLFILFGAPAVMLSLSPRPALVRRKKR